jgi:hypothetical protein
MKNEYLFRDMDLFKKHHSVRPYSYPKEWLFEADSDSEDHLRYFLENKKLQLRKLERLKILHIKKSSQEFIKPISYHSSNSNFREQERT